MNEPAQLTDSELELLSRSMDEDLSDFESKRLNKHVLSKSEATETWMRYHAVSAVMQKQFPTGIAKDFSSRVMRAVENEDMQPLSDKSLTTAKPSTSNSGGAMHNYMKQFAGLAVAASVAAVSVVVYQQQIQPGIDHGSSIIVSDKQEIPIDDINSATILPVEFSPAQIPAQSQIIGLSDVEESLSEVPEKEKAELEEVIGLQGTN